MVDFRIHHWIWCQSNFQVVKYERGKMAKKDGNTGIHVENKAIKLPTDIVAEIAAGFVSILEAGAQNRLEQSTIQRAIDGFAGIVRTSQPSLSISGCSISNS